MDQLKPAIDWCKRNIFWIGCFLLSAATIGAWFVSSGELAAEQKKRESGINKHLNDLRQVSSTTAEADSERAHPNASTQQGMDAEIDTTIKSIVRAWSKNYDEQKAILTWPVDILGKETCDFFSAIDVAEKVSDPGRGFEKYRKAYYDRIPGFMDKICAEVGINWQYSKALIAEKQRKALQAREDREQEDSRARQRDDGQDTSYIDELNRYPIVWEQANQDLWQQKLTTFRGYDDHTGAVLYPTFMQANMLQQDLWLLEAMFKNIKVINGDSTSNDTSVIQVVDHIVFGREAINKLGVLSEIDTRLAGTSAADGLAGAPEALPYQGGAGRSNAGATGVDATVANPDAYHNRYVDPNFESISATDVKAVLGGSTLPEKNLELIVAKRVPFRIAVEIDERKINEFIAICANSEFVFEVNQLRVNRHLQFPGEIEFNGGAEASSSGGGRYEEDSYEEEYVGGGAREVEGPREDLLPTPVESRTNFMVSVEFYGVVKIYNPVRENFLRLAAGQDVVDLTADLTEEVSDTGTAPKPLPEPTPPVAPQTAPAPAGPTDQPPPAR